MSIKCQKFEECCLIFAGPKVTSSDYLFFVNNSPKPKFTQIAQQTVLTIA